MRRIPAILALLLLLSPGARADDLPVVEGVEAQPLLAQARRVVEALDLLGQPLSDARPGAAREAAGDDPQGGRKVVQEVLDPHLPGRREINPESRVKAVQGPAAPEPRPAGLAGLPGEGPQRGGRDGPPRVESPNAAPVYKPRPTSPSRRRRSPPADDPRAMDGGGDVRRPPLEPRRSRAWGWNTA